MSKNLNLPNILALFRIALAPLMLWFFVDRNNTIFSSWHPSWFDYFAGLVFVIASVTDFFDGFIARRWRQKCGFGDCTFRSNSVNDMMREKRFFYFSFVKKTD